MAISSGINLQKIGVAATLFATSFTHAGVVPDNVELDIIRRVVVPPQPLSEPQSFLHSGVPVEPAVPPDNPSGGLDVGSAHHRDATPSTQSVVAGGLIDDAAPAETEVEIQRRVVVEVDPIAQTASYLHETFLADNVELDINRQLVVGTDPLTEAVSLTRGFAVPEIIAVGDPPEGLKALVEAEQYRPATSITQGTFLADDVAAGVNNPSGGLDVGSAHHRDAHTPLPQVMVSGVPPDDVAAEDLPEGLATLVEAEPYRPATSITQGTFLADNIELDIQRQLVVAAHPLADAISLTRGFAVPEIVAAQDPPEGLRALIEAEQYRPATSVTQGTFLAADAVVDQSSGGLDVKSTDHQSARIIPPQVTVSGVEPDNVVPEFPAPGGGLITTAEPLPEARSFIGQALNLELGASSIAIHEELPTLSSATSIMVGGIVPDDFIPPEPADGRGIIVTAEPISLEPAVSFTLDKTALSNQVISIATGIVSSESFEVDHTVQASILTILAAGAIVSSEGFHTDHIIQIEPTSFGSPYYRQSTRRSVMSRHLRR